MFQFAPALETLDNLFGEPIRWWRALGRCPCRDPQTDEWDRTHALCGGTGVLREEQDITGYKAIVTDATSVRQFGQAGQYEAGTLLVSAWPDQIDIADEDWVLVPSRSRTVTEALVRGSGSADRLQHRFAIQVIAVFDQSGEIASGFTLSVDDSTGISEIEWSGGPSASETYTVRFVYNPLYQAITAQILDRAPDPDGRRIPRRTPLSLIDPGQMP